MADIGNSQTKNPHKIKYFNSSSSTMIRSSDDKKFWLSLCVQAFHYL